MEKEELSMKIDLQNIPESISILEAINPEECIQIVEKLKSEDRFTVWDQTPWVFIIENPNEEEQTFINRQIEFFLKKCREIYKPQEDIYFIEGWLTCWPEGTSMHEHIDNWDPNIESKNIVFSSVLYLNDDFDGGEIYFPNLGGFSYSPQCGKMIIFPTESYDDNFKHEDGYTHSHLHGIKPIVSGNRYTLSLWAAKI